MVEPQIVINEANQRKMQTAFNMYKDLIDYASQPIAVRIKIMGAFEAGVKVGKTLE